MTSPKVGTGEKSAHFDAWHVNSVAKNFEGDYLLSTRHGDQILKIAGKDNVHGVEPGTTLWRLGGGNSDILNEGGFTFSKQHHVRCINTTEQETILSIFDNAWEGALKPTSPESSGMVVSVNNRS